MSLKTFDKIFAIILAVLGLIALIAAVFYGAKHQYLIVGICTVLVLVLTRKKED